MRATEGDTSSRAATSFGYHVRRRRLALDLTQAALASRVGCSTATVKKIEQDQRRPSPTMARRLAESLEVDDGDLFVAVAIGEVAATRLGEPRPHRRARDTAAVSPPPTREAIPAWLARAAASRPFTVVGRTRELDELDRHLHDAVAGDGRVVFVSGEAGQGKTSLLSAFAARAQAAMPDLVVARGYGTAASGLGDPYLPFRDVLSMLLVDPAARWQADHLDVTQASALWRFAPAVAATLVREGPRLLDLVVPATTVAQRLDGEEMPPSNGDRGGGGQVVAQLTATLVALAEQRPLLVLLDDLQWADAASTELLFHLSRRLAHSRLLVIAAFRSSEVLAADPAGEPARAALRRTVLEIQRDAGERGIDLDALDPDGSRALSDALVDLEPNRLDDDFRARLFELTRGHPLFVLELLRELRGTGELIRDDDGRWLPGVDLDWGAVPARVHAVIEQRLSRVTPDARRTLEIAAVIGEHFTPDVVAQVAGADEGDVLRLLSRELDREHHLVRETGATVVAGREVARFRFAHGLFQQDLYASLGTGERRDLHGRIAAALADRHAADDGALLPLLAHHYSEAGDLDRAVEHLVRAGDRARDVYANDEAIHLYARAVGFLRSAGDDGRLGRTLMKLALSHQLAFDHEHAQAAYDEAFALLGTPSAAQPVESTATLRMAWNEPSSLDPTLGGYDMAAPVATQLFRGLVAYGHDLEVLPDLAARWELHDGGRRYVFHLQDDVVWSDGVPVTAHDVAFTYRRALDPALGAPVAPALLAAVKGARELHQGAPADEVVFGVRAEDDRTVVIELTEPTAYFIHNLAYYVLLVVPRHVVSAAGSAWAQPPTLVGNGPFVVTSWERGEQLLLERNPRYRGLAAGNVARVDLDLTPGADVAQLYLDDRVDVVPGWFAPPTALQQLLRQRPDDTDVEEQFGTIYYATGPRPPLDDVRVRQALAMAVDRTAVARAAWGDTSRPATGGFVPPGMPGHSEVTLPFDRAAAARTLAEAGAPGSRTLTLAARPTSAAAAEALAAGWRTVGLDFRVQLIESPVGDVFEGADVVLGGWWADYPDPDNFLRVCVELVLPHWRHRRYAELLDAAARSDVQAERLDHYAAAERILAEEAVLGPLAHPRQIVVTKPWVQGYRMLRVKHPGAWKDVSIGPAT